MHLKEEQIMNANENAKADTVSLEDMALTSSERSASSMQEGSIPEVEQLSESSSTVVTVAASKEIGGPRGLEPTRYGDWEAKGRCYDF